jgi:hypothetical protein
MRKAGILMLLVLFGCSGSKGKKPTTEMLDRAMDREGIRLFISLGRLGSNCGVPFVDRPIPEQVEFYASQKVGLISITPDGPGFWKVELVNPKPEVVEGLKKTSHNIKDGCDSMILGYTVATKSTTEITDFREIGSGKAEVDFLWKWALSPTGAKLVSFLTEQDVSQLNDKLKTTGLGPRNQSFSLTNMSQSSMPQSGRKTLLKSRDGWISAEANAHVPVVLPSPGSGSGSSDTNKDIVGLPKPGKWVRTEMTDKMDGHKIVQFKTLSSNSVRSSNHEDTLLLGIACDQSLELYIKPGPVSVPTIRYKFDDSATSTDKWVPGNDENFLATSVVTRGFLKQMMKAKTFKIEFTPVGQEAQIASFDMGNFKDLIQREKGCDFRKKAFPLDF